MRGVASVPKRLANALVVLFDQHGDISREFRKSGQTWQSMYRDARAVVKQIQDQGHRSKSNDCGRSWPNSENGPSN